MAAQLLWGSISFHLDNGASAYPNPDAVVLEEDTFLLMSTEGPVKSTSRSTRQLIRDTEQTLRDSALPGNALVRQSKPLKLLAIIHDIEQSPTWSENSIASALSDCIEQAEFNEVRHLRIPFMPARGNGLAPEKFLRLLFQSLQVRPLRFLRIISLVSKRADFHLLSLESALQTCALKFQPQPDP